MNKSEQIGEIAKALAAFQGAMPPVAKDRTATVKTKSGAEYTYDYADLATVLEAARPLLKDHGLSVSQMTNVTDKGLELETIVMHTSGQWISGTYPLPHEADAQELGSEITYARRYAFCAALRIAAEEDDDANRKAKAPEIKNATPIVVPNQAPAAPAPASSPSLVAPLVADEMCCGKPMTVSKVNKKQLYCKSCRKGRVRAA